MANKPQALQVDVRLCHEVVERFGGIADVSLKGDVDGLTLTVAAPTEVEA
jgi:hypothetical protein